MKTYNVFGRYAGRVALATVQAETPEEAARIGRAQEEPVPCAPCDAKLALRLTAVEVEEV